MVTLLENTNRNRFWKEILLSSVKFSKKNKIQSNLDILASLLWYNPDASNITLFFPNWFKHGIIYVGIFSKMTGVFKVNLK